MRHVSQTTEHIRCTLHVQVLAFHGQVHSMRSTDLSMYRVLGKARRPHM